MIDTNMKEYRKLLGFANKAKLKSFFDSKDIVRDIDYGYLELLNKRLEDIIKSIDKAVVSEIKVNNINCFVKENVYEVYEYMKNNGLLFKFQNNKQRQLERSYYDWSRGRVVANYLKKAMAKVFNVSVDSIKSIGMDNLDNPLTFSKTATADFEITDSNNDVYRIEFQCGFQGVNDIKEHKVLEARRVFKELNIHSLIIHVDLFNGYVAFVDISDIQEKDINWITRTQFEGKKVFNINEKYFIWCLTEQPPNIKEIFMSE